MEQALQEGLGVGQAPVSDVPPVSQLRPDLHQSQSHLQPRLQGREEHASQTLWGLAAEVSQPVSGFAGEQADGQHKVQSSGGMCVTVCACMCACVCACLQG